MSRLLSLGRLSFKGANYISKSCILSESNTFKPGRHFPSCIIQKRDSSFKHFRNTTPLYYCAAVGVLILGFSYAAVPLYRIFCQVSEWVFKAVGTKLRNCTTCCKFCGRRLVMLGQQKHTLVAAWRMLKKGQRDY